MGKKQTRCKEDGCTRCCKAGCHGYCQSCAKAKGYQVPTSKKCKETDCPKKSRFGCHGYCFDCCIANGHDLPEYIICKNYDICGRQRRSGFGEYCQSCGRQNEISLSTYRVCKSPHCKKIRGARCKGYCVGCFYRRQVKQLRQYVQKRGSRYALYYVLLDEVPLSRTLYEQLQACRATIVLDIFHDLPLEQEGRVGAGLKALRQFFIDVGIDPFENPFEDEDLLSQIIAYKQTSQ